MTPLYGRLAQVMGRKGVMILALTFFLSRSFRRDFCCRVILTLTTDGTFLCAIAPTMYFMLFARAVAGAGCGGLLTVTVSLHVISLLSYIEQHLGYHHLRPGFISRQRTVSRRDKPPFWCRFGKRCCTRWLCIRQIWLACRLLGPSTPRYLYFHHGTLET